MQIVNKKISTLKAADYNPRRLTKEQAAHLEESLSSFDIVEPAVVNMHEGRENIIVGGHQRIKIAKKLGIKEFPCVEVCLPIEKEKELNIRLNKNTGEFDYDILANEFEIEELIDWGFDESDFGIEEAEPEDGLTDDDAVPEAPAEPISKLGDLWILGEHRLLCGDSASVTDVERLMDGKKADMVFTDPPYGMKKESVGVINDNLNYDDLLEFNREWIPNSFLQLKDNGSWYCWGIDEPLMDIYSHIIKPMIKSQQATFRNLITWNKGGGQGQNSEKTRSYATADEKCLFVMCGVQGFNNNTDNYFDGWDPILNYLVDCANNSGLTAKKLKEVCGVDMFVRWFSKSQWSFIPEKHYLSLQKEYPSFKKEYKELKKEYKELKKEYYDTRAYFNNTHDNMNNVWNFNRHVRNGTEGGHATPKPIELCARAIKSSSRIDEVVLDIFGGSGSTLISCEKTKRKCFMMELDPHYVDVIVKRWEDFTGNKAILEANNG